MKMLFILSTIFFATTILAENLPPNCADHPDDFFVNNPKNCAAYWYCAHAEADPLDGSCDAGYNFNQRDQICDLPENYPCSDEEPEDPEPEDPEPEDPPPQPPRSVCEGHPNGRLVNNPTACRSFFECLNEIPFPRQCDVGLNFNEDWQSCEHPSLAPCSNDDFRCPFSGISRWEISGSCTDYNFCFSGQQRIRTCSEGLHFDTSISLCSLKQNVGCTRDLCPISNDIEDIVYHPSEEDCEQYYICYNGNLELQHCASGTHWNQERRQCERPEDAQCEINTPEPDPDPVVECRDEDGFHLVPHPEICQNYFICSPNIPPYEQQCRDGLLFDAKLLACNFENQATCADVATRRFIKPKSNLIDHIISKV